MERCPLPSFLNNWLDYTVAELLLDLSLWVEVSALGFNSEGHRAEEGVMVALLMVRKPCAWGVAWSDAPLSPMAAAVGFTPLTCSIAADGAGTAFSSIAKGR